MTSSPDAAQDRPWALWSLIFVLILVSLGCVVAGNGPLLALAPVFGFLFIYALCKVPLRVPAVVLFTSAFLLEIPSDNFCGGQWKTPLNIVGALLFGQLKQTVPVGALIFTGMDLVLIGLFSLHAVRRARRDPIDRVGQIVTPMPFYWAAWAALLGCAFAFMWGMAHGGSFRFSLWQIQRVIYLPLVFLLLSASFPTPFVYRNLAKILIVAACIRAVLAVYLRRLFPHDEYVTTHPDSMLFATVTCMLLIRFLEERSRKSLIWMLVILPILVAGMIANDRRLVWVQIILALIFCFILAKRTKLKVRIVRGFLYVMPVLIGYIGAGWGSPSGIFAPVATIRSVIDSKSDTSTLWRDLENWNLVATLTHNPVIGTGYGVPYEMVVPMDDVTSGYELEPYAPHNSILGLWTQMGYVGFALHWMQMIVTVYFCVRVVYHTDNAEYRTVALTCLSSVVIYMVHLYGDLALGTWASVFLMSVAMVLSGKLARVVGAWPGPTLVSAPSLTPPIDTFKRHA